MADRRLASLLGGSFARFLVSGAANTAFTYVIYLVLLSWLPYWLSYSVAYASGIVLAYLMYRFFVFKRSGGRMGPLLVAGVYVLQYLSGLALVHLWVQWIAGPVELAPAFSILILVPLTYLLNRRVFSRAGPTPGELP